MPLREKKEKKIKQNRSQRLNNQPLDQEQQDRIKKRKKINKEITLIAYIFFGLFVLLIGNFVRFIQIEGKDVINSSYNKRQNLLEQTIERGMILGNNGEVLAKTEYDSNDTMTRVYPYRSLFAHSVGRYLKTKTGLENTMSFPLLTSSINPLEKAWNDIAGERSPGNNLITTLDVDLQKVASDALGSKQGAVVVLEPSTGKILTMVSKPDYDPNKVEQNWETLTSMSSDKSALLNRTTQGLYSPGSIYKVITAVAYMREFPDTYMNFSYHCDGVFHTDVNGYSVRCSNNKKHGDVTFETAFSLSCNGAYAKMLSEMNLDKFKQVNESFLFNSSFGLDFSVAPSKFTLASNAELDLIAQTAMGQGNTLMSPMHAAMIASAVANGGKLMKPYMMQEIQNANGNVVESYSPTTMTTLLSAAEAKQLEEMMELTVSSGTGAKLRSNKYQAAGKTGTAEVDGKRPNSWFIGYASTNGSPDIAIAVIVEDAGAGSDYAVPIAKKVFDAFYKKR